LVWQKLDADGHAVGDAVAIAKTAPTDVDVVAAGTSFVFAWTSKGAADAQVTVAAIDEKGHVASPRELAPDRGGSSLLGLAASGGGATLAWEEARRRPLPIRQVHFARIDAQARSEGAELTLDLAQTPEMRPVGDGIAVLAAARACPAAAADCGNAPIAPMFVR